MSVRYFISIFYVFSFFLVNLYGEEIEADKENQIWGTLHYYRDIGNFWISKLQLGTRRDRDGRQAFHHHIQAGIEYRGWCDWTPGAHYRYVEKRVLLESGSIEDEWEHQGFFDCSNRFYSLLLTPLLRNRLQFKSLNQDWIYRLKGEIVLPKGIYGAPFISEEIFWEIGKRQFEKRTMLGVEFPLWDSHLLRVALMQRSRKGNSDVMALRLDWTRELPRR